MYTHYFSEHLKRMNVAQFWLANRLYRGLLACITRMGDPTTTLLDIIQAHAAGMHELTTAGGEVIRIDDMMDLYFHEFNIDGDNKTVLFPENPYWYWAWFEFCKTSRKLYDIAVAGVQYALWMALEIPMHNDSKSGFPVIHANPLYEYSLNELHVQPGTIYDLPKMYELIKEYVPLIISAWQPDKPGLNLEEIGKDDPTRVGQLTIYGKANVWDLRHIADMIEKWERFSPADGMYVWQPSWVFTKS